MRKQRPKNYSQPRKQQRQTVLKKVWFVPQEENNLHYDVIKQNCADKAYENNATYGYPAFFNSVEEFEQYKSSVPLRTEYIG